MKFVNKSSFLHSQQIQMNKIHIHEMFIQLCDKNVQKQCEIVVETLFTFVYVGHKCALPAAMDHVFHILYLSQLPATHSTIPVSCLWSAVTTVRCRKVHHMTIEIVQHPSQMYPAAPQLHPAVCCCCCSTNC